MVEELGEGDGGRWLVETETAELLFDLELMTFALLHESTGELNAVAWSSHLVRIEACKVGFCAYWLTNQTTTSSTNEHCWLSSDPVLRITVAPRLP